MIKHIFLDLDGTLLNSAGKVSYENIRAIRKANIPVTLVSARSPLEIDPIVNQLKLTELQIAFNGGLIYKTKNTKISVVASHFIENNTSYEVIRWINESFPDLSLSYYTKNSWVASKVDPGIDFQTKLTGQNVVVHNNLSDLVKDCRDGIFKIMLIDLTEKKLLSFEKELINLNIPNINIQKSMARCLEITSTSAQKAFGLKKIMEIEKLKTEEVAAFGDGYNDISMFKTVGTAVVMGNAPDEIKDIGNFVTKTNNENGVAYGIYNFF